MSEILLITGGTERLKAGNTEAISVHDRATDFSDPLLGDKTENGVKFRKQSEDNRLTTKC